MNLDKILEKTKKAAVKVQDLKNAFSAESSEGQFRVMWLRRFLVGLWILAAVLLALTFLLDVYLIFCSNVIKTLGYTGATGGGIFNISPLRVLLFYVEHFTVLSIVFDLWVALALGFLRKVWKAREQEKKESAFKAWHIVLAVTIIFGRSTGFFWSFLIAFIPTSGWFFFLLPFKFVLFPPFILIWGGFWNLLGLYFFITAAFLALVLLPLKIFSATGTIMNNLHIVDVTKAPFLGALVQFWYWFTGRELPRVETPPDDTKGARFATPREMAACHNKAIHKQNKIALGKIDNAPFFLETEKHALVMASTRSGKGVSLIIPHLLRYKGSAFVLDPKGENARATERQRRKINDTVHFLDPFGISKKTKSRFNPLSRFTPDNMEAESKALASALVMGEGGNNRDHWTAAGQQLLAALILYVYASPDFQADQKDLPTVRRLLLGSIDATLEAMSGCKLAGGLISDLAASFLNTPKTELGSIISTAQRETDILDNPQIVRCLSASGKGKEVDFSAWHKGTMTVYLCLAAPKFPVFNRWLRLVLTAALNEMTDTMNPPPLPVCFMLDELATLGHLAAVENAVGLAAGYGVQLFAIFQDVAQMKDLYKGRWASFIGNAGIKALFNLDDYETAKYWSNFMGSHLVETVSMQQNVYGLNQGANKGEAMRPLLSPEEIMLHFAGGTGNNGGRPKILILSQGEHPIKTDRVPYYDDTHLKGLWDDPRNYSI